MMRTCSRPALLTAAKVLRATCSVEVWAASVHAVPLMHCQPSTASFPGGAVSATGPPARLQSPCKLQAHLRGEHSPFSAVELDEVVSRTAGASRELGLVEREVTAYWTAEFFRQQRERDADQTWTALLLQWIRVVRQRKQRHSCGQPHGACC